MRHPLFAQPANPLFRQFLFTLSPLTVLSGIDLNNPPMLYDLPFAFHCISSPSHSHNVCSRVRVRVATVWICGVIHLAALVFLLAHAFRPFRFFRALASPNVIDSFILLLLVVLLPGAERPPAPNIFSSHISRTRIRCETPHRD